MDGAEPHFLKIKSTGGKASPASGLKQEKRQKLYKYKKLRKWKNILKCAWHEE